MDAACAKLTVIGNNDTPVLKVVELGIPLVTSLAPFGIAFAL